jgi:hypothetical protein
MIKVDPALDSKAKRDDSLTLIALGVVAFALTDVTHEALGHGLMTLLVRERAVLLTTCYFTSNGPYSHWIPAAGGLMNLVAGFVVLAVLHWSSRIELLQRYFLVLFAAFNLFFAFSYPAYSGLTMFGDWATVTQTLQPAWLWRTLLVVVSVVGYYASMRLLAWPLAPFAGVTGDIKDQLHADPSVRFPSRARIARLTWIPYAAAIALACAAGARNPSGWHTMLTAGLPAAAAAFGLTQMDHFVSAIPRGSYPVVAVPLRRSWGWVAASALVAAFFVGVLGPGIRFSH